MLGYLNITGLEVARCSTSRRPRWPGNEWWEERRRRGRMTRIGGIWIREIRVIRGQKTWRKNHGGFNHGLRGWEEVESV